VLDLGAYPGSFLQVAAPIIGPKGFALGFDLKPVKELSYPWVKTKMLDIFDTLQISEILMEYDSEVDVILSDLAPSTSGISDVDHGRSIDLNRQVMRIAHAYLKKRGSVVLKIFMGDEFEGFLKTLRGEFEKVRCLKPRATRQRSRETYIIAQKFQF